MISTTIYNFDDGDGEQRPPDDEWNYEIYERCVDGSIWWIRTWRKTDLGVSLTLRGEVDKEGYDALLKAIASEERRRG